MHQNVEKKKCSLLKTIVLAVKWDKLAIEISDESRQPKVSRVEIRALAGLFGPQKPGKSLGEIGKQSKIEKLR